MVIVDGGDKLDIEDEFDGSDALAHARMTSTTVLRPWVSRVFALVFRMAFDILALDPLDSRLLIMG